MHDVISSMNNPKKVAYLNWEMLNLYDHGPIERQGPELCWLFTIVDFLQAMYRKVPDVRVRLSKQELLDKCNDKASVGSRYGMKIIDALVWVLKNGICFEDDYRPFSGIKGEPIDRSPDARVVRISGFILDGEDEDAIMEALASQPVIARLDIDQRMYYHLAGNYSGNAGNYSALGMPPYALPRAYYRHTANHVIQLTGWRSGLDDNCYYVRDPNSSNAPGDGRYLVKRPSSVDSRVEINPILLVAYVCKI